MLLVQAKHRLQAQLSGTRCQVYDNLFSASYVLHVLCAYVT